MPRDITLINMKVENDHRNYFIYSSHHFTPQGRYELNKPGNKFTSLPMCGFIAQLVEHRESILPKSQSRMRTEMRNMRENIPEGVVGG